jgi:hypothetical protein
MLLFLLSIIVIRVVVAIVVVTTRPEEYVGPHELSPDVLRRRRQDEAPSCGCCGYDLRYVLWERGQHRGRASLGLHVDLCVVEREVSEFFRIRISPGL